MKNILFIVSLISVISCSNSNEETFETKQDTSDSKIKNLRVETNISTEIDSSGIMMFPLRIGSTVDESRISGSFKSEKNDSYWNIIFYNTSTKQKHILSSKKMLINDFNSDYVYSSSSSSSNFEKNIDINSAKKIIFYNIITEDYNLDKKLNFDDPEYLFYTDKFGKNLTQISPRNASVIDWKYIKKSNKVIFNVYKDSNNDKIFNEKDQKISMEYDFGRKGNSEEIFSNAYKDSLLVNFKTNWNIK